MANFKCTIEITTDSNGLTTSERESILENISREVFKLGQSETLISTTSLVEVKNILISDEETNHTIRELY